MHPRYVLREKRKKKKNREEKSWKVGAYQRCWNTSSFQAFHSLTECQQKLDRRTSWFSSFQKLGMCVCVCV